MWLGEKINEHGIGNGISMILFANIISRVPQLAIRLWGLVFSKGGFNGFNIWGLLIALVVIVFMVAIVALIVCVTNSERRIPIQYAKRVVGRKMYGGQGTNLPLKVNMTGVMPIIFASSIVSLIPTILALCGVTEATKGFWGTVCKLFATDGVIYPVSLFILIIAFSYFYTQITFDPMEVSNNLKRQGGAIPGIRQGRPTAEYIKKILSKITLAGALFLAFIALLPQILGPHVLRYFFEWIYEGMFIGTPLETYGSVYAASYANNLVSVFTFGGTTLLIVVGVAIETFRELEAQLTMRNYKGFLN
jgi:preprotein translocase subunit SecY